MGLAISIITIIMGISVVSNFAIYNNAFSQFNSNYIRHTIDGDLNIDIPRNWFPMHQGNIFSYLNCQDNSCVHSNEGVIIMVYNIPDGAKRSGVFNFAIQQNLKAGMVSDGQPVEGSNNLVGNYVWQVAGQQTNVHTSYFISGSHLFIVNFIYLPQFEQQFFPIVRHITSTWTTSNPMGASGLDSSPILSQLEQLDLENQMNQVNHCANMNIIGSMNLNPGHEEFDPTCNQWRPAP